MVGWMVPFHLQKDFKPGSLTPPPYPSHHNRRHFFIMNNGTFHHMPDGQTRLLGVIGDPIAHTLSPVMHNLALAQLKLNIRYLAFHVRPDQLANAVRGFAAMGMMGFNATVPHKEPLLALMDWLDPLAQRIGAVNTVSIDADGRLCGFNSDAQGFTDALAEQHPIELSKNPVVVLGAGGAARGVVVGLLEAGTKKITVANRTQARAEQLIHDLQHHYPQAILQAAPLEAEKLPLEESGLLVNTTTLGLHGENIQMVNMARLPQSALVYDIVYKPNETPLLQEAKKHNLAILNGLGMLIHQGARAFEIWTGQTMPVLKVRERLAALL